MGYLSTDPAGTVARGAGFAQATWRARGGLGDVTCEAIPKKYEKAGNKSVTKGKVECTTQEDAVKILRGVVKRAVEMLDRTIDELTAARESVCTTGTFPPKLRPIMACWLKHRLSVCIDDITPWTGGPLQSRSVAEVIRRLVRPRNLLANNRITYECVSSCKSPTTYAWVDAAPGGVCLENPEERIRLCPRFWNPGHAKFREQDLIHEAVHLTHCAAAEDEGTRITIGSPECLAQFVASTNGKPLDPEFRLRCGFTTKCGGPIPKDCLKTRPPEPADWKP
ncbi:MAG: hypothetical protein WBW78_12630 [Terrimicrobiaceae bacterium]